MLILITVTLLDFLKLLNVDVFFFKLYRWSNNIISIKKGKFPLDWRHKFITAKGHFINIEGECKL